MPKEMFARKDVISPQMQELQEELNKSNVVPFPDQRPITGGNIQDKEPWLRGLEVRDLFIAQQRKGFTTCLDEYRVMAKEEEKGETFTLLRQNRRRGGKDDSDWEWHGDEEFSNENKLKKVLDG